MVAINRVPENLNYLTVIGFNFILQKAPHVEFFVQDATVPSLSLPSVDVANPFVSAPFAGSHLNYESLNLSLIVDENLEGYQEMHNWITGLGYPKDYKQHGDLVRENIEQYQRKTVYSDMSLTLLTSLKNPNIQFNFRDAWPTSISGWTLTHTSEDVQMATFDVSFRYNYFDLEIVRPQ